MKTTKIATALSIVGVLGAGSAAALVNTQILDSGSTESGASAAVLPEPAPIDLTVPEMASERNAVSTRIVATTDPTTTVPEPALLATGLQQAAPAASGMLTAFNVGDAGVVTVDVIDGQLVLVSAEPKAGWTLGKAEDDSNDDSDAVENEVEVEFTSASVRVEFEAHLVDGQIVPKVESEAIGGTTTANPTPAVPNIHADDDDEYDDDEYDDESDDDEYDDESDDDESDDDESDDDQSDDDQSEDDGSEDEDDDRDDD
jgi:hypothetical protein